MRTLQLELDHLREEHAREKDMAARRAREDAEQIQMLRERLEAGGGGGGGGVSFFYRCHARRPKLNSCVIGRP